MGAGPVAVVLTPYAVEPMFVRGGAQRVAAELCDRLTELSWTVQVIESLAWRDTTVFFESFVGGMKGHAATTRSWRDAFPATAISAADAAAAARTARLMLVLDRAIGSVDTAAHRVLLLSNLVYDNERRAAEQGDHQAVWVPSEYLARQAAACVPATVDIHVVPPALAESRCEAVAHEPLRVLDERLTAAGVPRGRRLLFPHRTDPGKGLPTALAVLQHLLMDDRWALIVVRPSERKSADAEAVVDDAQRRAAAAGIDEQVFWAPWLPQSEVLCLYGLVGVTLMPTTLEEGFGLVAVESVTQGVPVVVRPAGNLSMLGDRFSGIHPADDVTEMANVAAAISGQLLPDEQRHAVYSAFSVDAQRASLKAAMFAGGIGA